MDAPNAPRFLDRPGGLYEVWYVTFVHRGTGKAYWIRYTVDLPRAGSKDPARAGVWFARFDPRDPATNLAVQSFHALAACRVERTPFSFVHPDGWMREGKAAGSIAGGGGASPRGGGRVSWDLSWPTDQETFLHYPDLFYRGGFPRTKILSPALDVPIRGRVETPEGSLDLDGEPGEQTHLWGTRHARRWAWGHCNAFLDTPGAVFEGLSARVALGPFDSPFLSLLHVRAGSETHTMHGVPGILLHRVRLGPGPIWRLVGTEGDTRIRVRLSARPCDLIQVEYHEPDGSRVHCHNTEVADATVLVEKNRGEWVRVKALEARGTAALEFAGPPGKALPGSP